MKTHLILSAAQAFTAAWLAIAAPAAAQSLPRSTVRVDDLDLARPAARDQLDARIVTAAKRTCGDYAPTGTRVIRFDLCLEGVRAEVMAKLADTPRGRAELAARDNGAGAR